MPVTNVLTIAGGVALILFGVRFMRKGLDRLFGQRLRIWIQRLTNRRLRAFFSGIIIALIAPSSTTMSVLAVQTIREGHATSKQMLALIFGADIGMTVMIFLLAVRLEAYSPVLLLLGIPFYQFTSASRTRGSGQVVASLGFILLGVMTIKNATAGVQLDQALIDLIDAASHYLFVLSAIFAVLAVVLQSSTAAIALVIALSAGSHAILIRPETALAAVIGANVGIGLTTLIIAWGQLDARRLALGNLLAKTTVAALALFALPYIKPVLADHDLDLPMFIAVAHTTFNVVLSIIAVPNVGPISWLTYRLVPEPSHSALQSFGPKYISARPDESVALATGQSLREILRVAEIVRSMLNDLWTSLKTNDEQLNKEVTARDDQVDLLDRRIKRFLTRLAAQGLDRDDAAEQIKQLRYLNELETSGDIIEKNLSELTAKKIRQKAKFSDEGWQELEDFCKKVIENMEIAETAFSTRDPMLARTLLRHKERMDLLEGELRDRHFKRLNAGLDESLETSAIHLDLLTHLRRVNSSVSHIAYAILPDPVESIDYKA